MKFVKHLKSSCTEDNLMHLARIVQGYKLKINPNPDDWGETVLSDISVIFIDSQV